MEGIQYIFATASGETAVTTKGKRKPLENKKMKSKRRFAPGNFEIERREGRAVYGRMKKGARGEPCMDGRRLGPAASCVWTADERN